MFRTSSMSHPYSSLPSSCPDFSVSPPSSLRPSFLPSQGELIFENLKDLDQVQGRLWKMNSLAVRKPRVEEAKKISLGYELWKKETEEINLNENLTIPVPGVPGVNLLRDQIYAMKKRNHGQHAYLAEVPLDEMGAGIDYQRPFKSFVHLQYTEVDKRFERPI